MSLIVEDGTGIVDADSYNSIEEIDFYMQKMGYNDWPVSDDEDETTTQKKEASARRAAIYLDTKYAPFLTGTVKNPEQGLAWPRENAVDYLGNVISDSVVPKQEKSAHCEVSRLVFTGTALTSDTAGPLLKRKKIDVLEWEWDSSTYGQAPTFGWIDQLLYGLYGPPSDPNSLDIFQIQRA